MSQLVLCSLLVYVLSSFSAFQSFGQIKAEQYLIGTSGNQGDFPGGGNISWTVGEVVVFTGSTTSLTILSGMQSYPICYQNSQMTILGSSPSLCGSVPVVLSVSGTYSSYQWYLTKNGVAGKIVGATSASYSPVIDGIYSVYVTMVGGFCSFTSSGYNVSLASGVGAPTITPSGPNPNDTLLTSSSASSYEWYVDDRRIVGETNQSYKVLFNGKYYVKVRYPGGCVLVSNVYTVKSSDYLDITKSNAIISDSTVYFPKENGFAGIQIHPNPTTEFVTVSYFSSTLTKPVIQLFTGEGKMIFEDRNPLVFQGNKKFEVDLRLLPRAMYYLKLSDGDTIVVEKVIKY